MSTPLRVATVGFGYWGPNVVRVLASLDGVELAICCDGNAARLREFQARYDVPATDRLGDVLEDESITAVVLATPAATHRDLTLACIERDKHVLVEKPFAITSADAEAMYDASERRELVLEAGHIFLYNPSVEALRRAIARGALGDVRTAFAVRASHGPRARNDVDATYDCMVHDLYILQDLLGPFAEVSASGASFLTPGVADSAFARLRLESGAQAFCYASWYEPVKTRRMTLTGARAMADYDDLRDEEPVRILEQGYEPIEGIDAFGNVGLRHFDRGGSAPPVAWEEPLRREIETFVRRVRGERREPGVTPASVLAVTRVLEAIGRSMARGGAPERIA